MVRAIVRAVRIFIPTIDYPPIEGGIGTVSLEVARACAEMGHEVVVLAPWFAGMEAFDAAEPYRVVRFKGYNASWLRLLPFLRAAWPLAQNADLVLAINVSYGGVLARLLRARQGTPYVCFAYAYEFLKFAQAPPARALLRGIYRHAACTIAISRFTRDAVVNFGAPPDRVRVVLPGAGEPAPRDESAIAAVRRKLGVDAAPFVLAVGRFIPRKNHMALIEAWPAVLARYPDAHLVLVGRGPEWRDCQQRIERLGLGECIHCPGYLDDAELSALYHDCAFFALPNGEDRDGQVEGFGLVFAEASAHGKAVIAGDSGGARDAVLHEVTGLLVPPKVDAALTSALLRLLGDAPLRDKLGAAGRERVRVELNWRRFTEQTLKAAGWGDA